MPPRLAVPADRTIQPRRVWPMPVRALLLFLGTLLVFLILYNTVEWLSPGLIRKPWVVVPLGFVPGTTWAVITVLRYRAAMKAYRRARELVDQQDLPAAERVLKRPIRLVRGGFQQLLLAECARVVLLRREPGRALQYLASAEAHGPHEGGEEVHRQIPATIAFALAERGDVQAAGGWLEEAAARGADQSWEAEAAKALIAKRRGDDRGARQAADAALAMTIYAAEEALIRSLGC